MFFFESINVFRTTSDELKLNRFYQRWTFVKETVIKQYQCLQSFRQKNPAEVRRKKLFNDFLLLLLLQYFVLGVIFLLIFAIYGQMIDNFLLSYYSSKFNRFRFRFRTFFFSSFNRFVDSRNSSSRITFEDFSNYSL